MLTPAKIGGSESAFAPPGVQVQNNEIQNRPPNAPFIADRSRSGDASAGCSRISNAQMLFAQRQTEAQTPSDPTTTTERLERGLPRNEITLKPGRDLPLYFDGLLSPVRDEQLAGGGHEVEGRVVLEAAGKQFPFADTTNDGVGIDKQTPFGNYANVGNGYDHAQGFSFTVTGPDDKGDYTTEVRVGTGLQRGSQWDAERQTTVDNDKSAYVEFKSTEPPTFDVTSQQLKVDGEVLTGDLVEQAMKEQGFALPDYRDGYSHPPE